MFVENKDDFELLSPPVSRRKARETALQGLYALELSGNSLYSVISLVLGKDVEDNTITRFTRQLIRLTHEQRDLLDDYIRNHSKNWKFERIAIIDRIIMRIAISEFINFVDIPPKVSIDEAIELSKLYSTDKSGGFINGILDAVYEHLKKEDKIQKTGRGCLDNEDIHV